MSKLILIIVMFSSLYCSEPSWFRTMKHENIVYGYGQDKNLDNAMLKAKTEISSFFSLHVIQEVKTIETSSGFTNSIKTIGKTDNILYGTSIIKTYHDNNTWYVVAEYINLSNVQRFAKLVNNLPESKESYLNTTSFGKELYYLIGYNVKLELIYIDNLWFLTSGDQMLYIENINLKAFFLDKGDIEMDYVIYHHDYLKFKWNKTYAYQTLVSVDSKGRCAIIEDNIQSDYYPNDGYTIQAESERKTVYEMIILFESDSPIKLRLEELNKEILSNDNILFDDLIYALDTYNYKSTIYKLKGN